MFRIYIVILISVTIGCSTKKTPEGEWVKARSNELGKPDYSESLTIQGDSIAVTYVDYTAYGRELIRKSFVIDRIIEDHSIRDYYIYVAKNDDGKYFPISFIELPDGRIRHEEQVSKVMDLRKQNWIRFYRLSKKI